MEDKKLSLNRIVYFWISLALLLLSLLAFTPAFGQKGYSPGFVFENKGDTLQGLIRDRTDDQIYTKIKFSPHQITGYIINGSVTIISNAPPRGSSA